MADLAVLDARDRVVFGQCPMAMAPIHGSLSPCAMDARRLISASDGVWVESRSPGIHFRGRIAGLSMPYGPVDGFCRLAGGLIPDSIMGEVFEWARDNTHEIACVVVWSCSEQRYRLIWPDVDTASPGHVTYSAWADTDDLRLVVDIHSHGRGKAYFSSVDDASDLSILEPHLSVVIGRCDQPELEFATRFCVGPYLINLPVPPF